MTTSAIRNERVSPDDARRLIVARLQMLSATYAETCEEARRLDSVGRLLESRARWRRSHDLDSRRSELEALYAALAPR